MDIIFMTACGKTGAYGENGTDITEKADNGADGIKRKKNYQPAEDGKSGANAKSEQNGIPGSMGEPGGNCGSLLLEVKEILSGNQLCILADGGDGGDGGPGGSGGCGGEGGDGGKQLAEYESQYPQTRGGMGGCGGNGADGGDGGAGGDGGRVTVRYVTSSLAEPVFVCANAGQGGFGGKGGSPGCGGKGGRDGLRTGLQPSYAPDGPGGAGGSGGSLGTQGGSGKITIEQVEELK